MKKFPKLVFSIVSMCFAVAILVFGVFAASQVNYTISGNISYTVTSVFCSIDTDIYYCTNCTDGFDYFESYVDILDYLNEPKPALTFQEMVFDHSDYGLVYDSASALNNNGNVGVNATLPTLNFKYNNNVITAYKIVVTVTIPSQSGKVKVTATADEFDELEELEDNAFVICTYNDTTLTNPSSTTTEEVEFYVCLVDVTANIDDLSFEIGVSVSKTPEQ